jgi:tetratricopeptide (TPR) repeat protein
MSPGPSSGVPPIPPLPAPAGTRRRGHAGPWIVTTATLLATIIALRLPFLHCILFVAFSYFRIHEAFPGLFPDHMPLLFATASLLARLYVERGQTARSIEWFEKAAQAPAPTQADSHQLLYELAAALENVGEVARSLAVSMELQADAGNYRDIARRIDRLAKAQARG